MVELAILMKEFFNVSEGGEKVLRLVQKGHKNSTGYHSTQVVIFWKSGSVSLFLRYVLHDRGLNLVYQKTVKTTNE